MRLACAQLPVVFGSVEDNLASAIRTVEEASRLGVDLVLFPECFLTGYCVASREEAERIAIPASSLEPLVSACERTGTGVVVGFAETAAGKLYNSAALIEPGQSIRIYRKTHLPELGLDKFVEPGDSIEPFDTRWGKIGVLVCFDLRHPEPTRCLAIQGADLIVLPTNWPVGAFAGPEFIAPARAAENKIFFATCNRPDSENGFDFIGQSGIYDVSGKAVAAAEEEETLLVADIDLSKAREKRTIVRPGEYETVILQSRRPELYGALSGQPMSSRV